MITGFVRFSIRNMMQKLIMNEKKYNPMQVCTLNYQIKVKFLSYSVTSWLKMERRIS